jgi:hypothetical protein
LRAHCEQQKFSKQKKKLHGNVAIILRACYRALKKKQLIFFWLFFFKKTDQAIFFFIFFFTPQRWARAWKPSKDKLSEDQITEILFNSMCVALAVLLCVDYAIGFCCTRIGLLIFPHLSATVAPLLVPEKRTSAICVCAVAILLYFQQ